MSPTGDLLVTSIFAGEVSSWACPGAFTCCAGMALSQWQHTLWGNNEGRKKERKRSCATTAQKEEDEEGKREK